MIQQKILLLKEYFYKKTDPGRLGLEGKEEQKD
jgi:hypothetical protein